MAKLPWIYFAPVTSLIKPYHALVDDTSDNDSSDSSPVELSPPTKFTRTGVEYYVKDMWLMKEVAGATDF
jgi:hypothetical protein